MRPAKPEEIQALEDQIRQDGVHVIIRREGRLFAAETVTTWDERNVPLVEARKMVESFPGASIHVIERAGGRVVRQNGG